MIAPPAGSKHYSQSLHKGLAIIHCFSPEMPALGIFQLTEMLDWPRSTTHRYVTTLVALGYLEQTTNRQYRLALGLTRLGIKGNERHQPTRPRSTDSAGVGGSNQVHGQLGGARRPGHAVCRPRAWTAQWPR
jgi:IclR helix-turn-helix domain